MTDMIDVLRRLKRGLENQEGTLYELFAELDRSQLFDIRPDLRTLRAWAEAAGRALDSCESLQEVILYAADVDGDDPPAAPARTSPPAPVTQGPPP